MKAKFFTIAMALFVGSLVTSCDKNDDDMVGPDINTTSDNSGISGTETAPDQSASRMAEDVTIGGMYSVLRYVERGEDKSKLFTGVTFNFAADNILYARSSNFEHKGVYGVDMHERVMKMHIEGNDLMKMISGYYRITDVGEDGKVHLVSNDGMKSIILSKGRPVMPYTGTVPKVIIPGRR